MATDKERADRIAAVLGLYPGAGTVASALYTMNGIGTPPVQMDDFGQYYGAANQPPADERSKQTTDLIGNGVGLAGLFLKNASPATKAVQTAAEMMATENNLQGLSAPVPQIADNGKVYLWAIAAARTRRSSSSIG
ncbi:MAG: hypothetical protein P4N41_16660 [Negativicutes bacterium]|nr:hypothetical protein [Negativicutes bacterium]MDR3591287.1 hypothetical protein [Negativicutes bacterium]